MNQDESQGIFYQKDRFLCRINAAVAIDQKCHQADRKKCKPIFHTKYFHSDQNRSQQSIGCTSKHRRVSKCRADYRWQSCQISQHKTKRCTDGKKRCHLSALKPDRQSQYRKEQLQNPVKRIQFSSGKCLRDQIGSKSAVPSVPRQKKDTASGIDTKPILLYGFSNTFPINCFTFAKAPQTAVPSDRTRFQKESDTSPSLCPSMTGSAKEDRKFFQPQSMRSCRCRKRRNCRRKQCGICHTSTHHYFHRKKTAANGV